MATLNRMYPRSLKYLSSHLHSLIQGRLWVKVADQSFFAPDFLSDSGYRCRPQVATVFLAQVFGVHLEWTTLLFIVATTVGASIGTPATPGVGIVILSTVLRSAGIPPSGIALIIGVDRILDMSRTTLNVTGDLAACTVMERLAGNRTDQLREAADEISRESRRQKSSEDVIIE